MGNEPLVPSVTALNVNVVPADGGTALRWLPCGASLENGLNWACWLILLIGDV